MNTLTLAELTAEAPPPSPMDWNDDGVVIVPGLIDDALIDRYMDVWKRENGFKYLDFHVNPYSAPIIIADRVGGWEECAPFMQHTEIIDLVAPLADHLEALTGDIMGMNLNLTGWTTTKRDWHQDSYLNEPEVGDYYAAVWIALGDIHPDSGPFQYVPGSHRWPQVTRDIISQHLDIADPDWPKHSERILTPLFTEEIERRGAEVVTHLPKRGDVLIWHGRLLHRGSVARIPGSYRPAFIAHFSGINHRPQMPKAVPWWRGGWYFPLVESGRQTSRGM